MAETTVSLKVFLKSEATSEARRFAMNSLQANSFAHVKEQLRAGFPSLHAVEFKVTWKDSDGDEITISTDDDLATAYAEMIENTKVLYVTPTQGSKAETQSHKTNSRSQGCPFSSGSGLDLKDMHALGALARQFLGPFMQEMQNAPHSGTCGQEGLFFDVIRNAANGFSAAPGSSCGDQSQPGASQQQTSQNFKPQASASGTTPKQSNDAKEPDTNGNAHSNPKIAKGLAQLHEMGFSNKDGVLTHLLELFDGNVTAVIRAVTET